MSSIPQQEPMKPAPKSPIPRSRSDFSYVGLTPKEKRWTTDFSLLLPPYNRDTSGYSRLTESPVTLQPKPRNQVVMKLCKSPDREGSPTLESSESKPPRKSPTSPEPSTSATSSTSYSINKTFKESKHMGRSQTMEPYIANGVSCNENKRAINSKIISRSPTLEPYMTNCNATNHSNESKRSKTRNLSLDSHVPKCSSSCSKICNDSKTLYPRMELNSIGCPKASHRLSPLVNRSVTDCNHHLAGIRKALQWTTRPFVTVLC
ncbi:uncharacterized protein CEXT_563681 [Caerostris extrusa]|uniref:Uncharacterized protein n=1 Tax=Caerostris extrusa TaxID=172846 RepID=A0AAV4TBE5_CAEEX|nr:uncharacterized protein CEXT_563681 [Caerostris extrusa]